MNIHTLPLGYLQTNCYILQGDSNQCLAIDPGGQPDVVLEFLGERKLAAILLTHGHFDHVGAVKALVKATDCALWMHEGDYSQTRSPQNAFFYPLANCTFTEVQLWEEGQVIQAAGLEFTVLSTPGHTWGSVCLMCEDHIFSGDTLFQDSCGRTDLPGGSMPTMLQSLKRLKMLEGDYAVHPGHGPSTTLADEKKYNPYMQ